jgi:hypothetical protein
MLLNKSNYFVKFGVIVLVLACISSCKGDDKNKQSSSLQNDMTSEKRVSQKAGPELANTLIKVRYFYSDSYRCTSCRKIEAYTKKAIMENFADELKSGKMEFSLVDIDTQENKPLIGKYKLFTKSVIVSEYSSGKEVKWRNLDKVWTLLNSEEAFVSYIVKEVKGYLHN